MSRHKPISLTQNIDFIFDNKIVDHHYTNFATITSCNITKQYLPDHNVLMQFSNNTKSNIMVCGTAEVLALLEFSIHKKQLKQLKIKYVPDGTVIKSKDALFSIKGSYEDFGWLENLISSILAKRSSTATNCYNILCELNESQDLIINDSCSVDYSLQAYDGYAAAVAGAYLFTTKAQVQFLKDMDHSFEFVDYIPNNMIQQYNGDLKLVIETYLANKKTNNLIVSLNYNNNVINDLENIREHLTNLYAISLDLSDDLIDESLIATFGNIRNFDLNGVNHHLVQHVRKWLDENDAEHIKIIIQSNNISLEDIKRNKRNNIAVDIYALTSNLNDDWVEIGSDLVAFDQVAQAPAGKKLAKNQDDLVSYKYTSWWSF